MSYEPYDAEFLLSLVGRSGHIVLEGALMVPVEIAAARENFGRIDVEVTPLFGSGTKWVHFDRFRFNKEG